MKMKSMTALDMKRNWTGSLALAGCAMVIAAVQSSCSTAGSVAWSKIQEEGLIPYMVEHSSSDMPEIELQSLPLRSGFEPETTGLVGLVESELPEVGSSVFTAQPVEGKPGFVFSPHSEIPLEVDVRGYRVGESVRCPYTGKIFVVPSGIESISERVLVGSEVVGAPGAATDAPSLAVTDRPEPSRELESESEPSEPSEPVLEAPRDEASLLREIAMAEGIPINKGPIPGRIARDSVKGEPSVDELLALPVKAPVTVPEGKRVPGKPNYVFSPFAASNQVVDVEGHEPGAKVKCPYSGKIFAVPAAAAPTEG